MFSEYQQQQLAARHAEHRYRQRHCIEQQQGRYIQVDGKRYLNFSSNDYLGLNQHPKLQAAMQEGLDRFGSGAGASSLVTGYHYAHQALEEQICQWLNQPRCLLFASGFAANSGVLQTIGHKQCQLWLDKLSHASIIDGAYGSAAKVKRFAHNDIAQLARLMKTRSADNDSYIVSEGVFSMDGDQAPVVELATLAKQHSSYLYIDDAHALGVIGQQGQGSSSLAAFDIVMGTFGKAIATSGAFIACNEQHYQFLVNFCRHYIYSTAISPAIAWATRASIELLQQEQWRRDKIAELSAQLIDNLTAKLTVIPSQSAIHALVVGDEQLAVNLSEQLKTKGIWLSAIRPPTVPMNGSRLRVTVCAHHESKDIKHLIECLNEIMN